jgi:NTP pyrophosphatase (non-canonical NTP hydrolase)
MHKELAKLAEDIAKALDKKLSHMDKETRAFMTMLKIHKKAGHLSGEVMKSFGYSSKEHAKEPLQLDNLMAGVVLKVFVLAKQLDVDMDKALERKIEAVREKIKNKW